MMVLIRHQQQLHNQVVEMRQPELESTCPPSPTPSHSSSSSSESVDFQWIQSFERRLTYQIRKTVRQELARAFKMKHLLVKTKKKKNQTK